MKANKFLAKAVAVTMVLAAAGAVLPDRVTKNYSITASARGSGEESDEEIYRKFIDDCRGHYGYDYLATTENGTNKQELYNKLYDVCCDVWINDEDYSTSGAAICLPFDDYGVSEADTEEVMGALCDDNPIFYFLFGRCPVSYGDDSHTTFELRISKYYYSGSVRSNARSYIYSYVTGSANEYDNDDTPFRKTYALRQKLISDAEYEFADDGSPSSRGEAYNILGIIIDGTGVCESYAETFTLLLNYADVDNICIVGYADSNGELMDGENHKWNLVKLDDDNYYWFDCTWDDILNEDTYLAKGNDPFLLTHRPATNENDIFGLHYYPLPKASDTDFPIPSEPDDGPVKKEIPGDANSDGSVDIEDAVVTISHITGIKPLSPTGLYLADVDDNGTVDIEDAVAIINHINGVSSLYSEG